VKSYRLLILLGLILSGLALSESALAAENAGGQQGLGSSFSLFSVVRPLGVATLLFVCATFLTGLFRKNLGRRFLKVHRPLAITSVILGVAHGTLVFVLYG
jgi:DMSO/TMAO reductase YedYZ heme-binding membrane subunit